LRFFLTGKPGVGKSTVAEKTVQFLAASGYKVGGVVCPEMRVAGRRVGFEIIDLATGRRGTLSHVDGTVGPCVGRYRVNVSELAEVTVGAFKRALRDSDFVVVDEIGPMELTSIEFIDAVHRVLQEPIPLLAILHWRMRHPLIRVAQTSPDHVTFKVTLENRDALPEEIAQMLIAAIDQRIVRS
jgi:nucleoside-triphosphatase